MIGVAIIGILAAIAIPAIEGGPPVYEVDYKAECIESTASFVGYHACDIDTRCDLTHAEQSYRDQALKDSVISCARMEFTMGMEAAEAMDGQTTEGDDGGTDRKPTEGT